MASTRCTCLREERDLNLVSEDPQCPAPSHLWDQLEQLGKELGIS